MTVKKLRFAEKNICDIYQNTNQNNAYVLSSTSTASCLAVCSSRLLSIDQFSRWSNHGHSRLICWDDDCFHTVAHKFSCFLLSHYKYPTEDPFILFKKKIAAFPVLLLAAMWNINTRKCVTLLSKCFHSMQKWVYCAIIDCVAAVLEKNMSWLLSVLLNGVSHMGLTHAAGRHRALLTRLVPSWTRSVIAGPEARL